jgi:hypothetical protein
MRALSLALGSFLALTSTSCAVERASCTRAQPEWLQNDPEASHHRPILSATVRKDGTISWLGRNIPEAKLIAYLQATRSMSPLPHLILIYERGISCERLNHFRRIYHDHGACNAGGICSEQATP